MVAEQVLDGVGKAHDSQGTADDDGEQSEYALFKIPEQIGNGTDDFVVQAQGEGHGASRYAGNDIGDADDHAFDDVKYKSHFVHLIFSVNGQVYTITYSGHSFNENFQLLVAWSMKNVYNSKLL